MGAGTGTEVLQVLADAGELGLGGFPSVLADQFADSAVCLRQVRVEVPRQVTDRIGEGVPVQVEGARRRVLPDLGPMPETNQCSFGRYLDLPNPAGQALGRLHNCSVSARLV